MGPGTKVVIDSNVFISAFGWDGKPEAVLRLVEQGRIINYTTVAIFEELKRVVAYPKLKFPQSLQVKLPAASCGASEKEQSGTPPEASQDTRICFFLVAVCTARGNHRRRVGRPGR